jgi:hypothetical protein
MEQSASSRPAPDEIELSVFGPGYGEAIALHVGGGQWVLVDSCLEPESGLSATLQYLLRLGVDVGRDVPLIVATHWHDDHIRGLYGLVNACTRARLCISSALRSSEFNKLVALYASDPASGVSEFAHVYEHLLFRRGGSAGGPIKLALADKLLYTTALQGAPDPLVTEIFAMSPSDSALLLAELALAQQSPMAGSARHRLIAPTPNHASVALWIRAGHVRVLLGADLENTSQADTGWNAVLFDSNVADGQADTFKVPHHGSPNGHHDQVWTQLLTPSPIAVVTPFHNGRHLLPAASDVARIRALTPNLYLTASPRTGRPRWRRRVVREFVGQVTSSIEPVTTGWGQVRLRCRPAGVSHEWQATLFGDTYRVP